MKRNWSEEELIESGSLSKEELAELPDRVDRNRLGFAVVLKFFEIEGRFPRSPREDPATVLSYLATQLHIPPPAFVEYDWLGRTGKRHRIAIRARLGFRRFTANDGEPLHSWLCQCVIPAKYNLQHLHETVLDGCRDRRIEPPSTPRIERIIASALRTYESPISLKRLAGSYMLQRVLSEPRWLDKMTREDLRALTPLIYHHVNPYGTFELDMNKRLPIEPEPELIVV